MFMYVHASWSNVLFLVCCQCFIRSVKYMGLQLYSRSKLIFLLFVVPLQFWLSSSFHDNSFVLSPFPSFLFSSLTTYLNSFSVFTAPTLCLPHIRCPISVFHFLRCFSSLCHPDCCSFSPAYFLVFLFLILANDFFYSHFCCVIVHHTINVTLVILLALTCLQHELQTLTVA